MTDFELNQLGQLTSIHVDRDERYVVTAFENGYVLGYELEKHIE